MLHWEEFHCCSIQVGMWPKDHFHWFFLETMSLKPLIKILCTFECFWIQMDTDISLENVPLYVGLSLHVWVVSNCWNIEQWRFSKFEALWNCKCCFYNWAVSKVDTCRLSLLSAWNVWLVPVKMCCKGEILSGFWRFGIKNVRYF